MDIDKIASILCEDISINNGVLFEADDGFAQFKRMAGGPTAGTAPAPAAPAPADPAAERAAGRATKKEGKLNKFHSKIMSQLIASYQKSVGSGQSHEEAMKSLQGKIEDNQKIQGMSSEKKRVIKKAFETIDQEDMMSGILAKAKAIEPEGEPEGPGGFSDLVSGMEKVGEVKKGVPVAGRKIDVELLALPTAQQQAEAQAAEAEKQKVAAQQAAATGETPEAATAATAATAEQPAAAAEQGTPMKLGEAIKALGGEDDPEFREQFGLLVKGGEIEKVSGPGGFKYVIPPELMARAQKMAATKAPVAAEAPDSAAGGWRPGQPAQAEDINHMILAISEGICNINICNGVIEEAIDPKISARVLKSFNKEGIKGTETHYRPAEFMKMLNAVWNRIVKGNDQVGGADLIDISKQLSGGIYDKKMYRNVLHIFKALKEQALPVEMKDELKKIKTPSTEDAETTDIQRAEELKQDAESADPNTKEGQRAKAKYSQKVLGIKKGEKSAKQAGDRLTQLVSRAKVGSAFKVKVPETGAITKITVVEHISEEYSEGIDGIVILIA